MLPIAGMLVCLSAQAEKITHSMVYEIGSERHRVLFEETIRELVIPNGKQVASIFKDSAGKPVLSEEVTFQAGQLQRYTVHQIQLGETGTVWIEKRKLHFDYEKGGNTSHATEDLKDNLVIGPTLFDYVTGNWKELSEGETLRIRFAVLERNETIPFQLNKVQDGISPKGDKAVLIKMTPVFLLARLKVKPISIWVSPDGLHILEVIGRTLPKLKKDGDWQDLDAESVFDSSQ